MEIATVHCTDSLALWAPHVTLGQQAVLLALWLVHGDPTADKPMVKISHADLAELAKLKTDTVRKALSILDELGALEVVRKRRKGRPVGYLLHQHPDAPRMVRAELRRGPVHEPPGERTKKPRKPRKLCPPDGVRRDQIAAQWETVPGVRSNLPYSGAGAWLVDDTIKAMNTAGWGLPGLAHTLENYKADPREDKPPPEKLFSNAAQRREAIERYGPKPTETPPPPSRPRPEMTTERWIAYFGRLVPPDEAERLVSEYRDALAAMGPEKVRQAVMAWKAQPTRRVLASIFAEHEP